MSPFECSERIMFERQLFKFQMFQHRCERKISESGSNHKMTCRDLIQRNVHNLGRKRFYISHLSIWKCMFDCGVFHDVFEVKQDERSYLLVKITVSVTSHRAFLCKSLFLLNPIAYKKYYCY